MMEERHGAILTELEASGERLARWGRSDGGWGLDGRRSASI